MLRIVVLIQYRRVTDGQTDRRTDGNAVASTALAMRAFRRAVKMGSYFAANLVVHSGLDNGYVLSNGDAKRVVKRSHCCISETV